MLIIAHRGASAIYSENTHQAFTQALHMGAHGLELDLQCTHDGKAVVFHDDTLERMTNGKGRVDAHTLSALKSYMVEGGDPILSLQEILDDFAGETTLWLEIKDPRCVDELVTSITQRVTSGKARYEDCVVIGFDKAALQAARQAQPALCIGYSLESLPESSQLDATLERLQPAYLVIHYELASAQLVKDMAQRGIQVVVWTLNEINDSLRMQERGVAGIITDVPNILYELFHG